MTHVQKILGIGALLTGVFAPSAPLRVGVQIEQKTGGSSQLCLIVRGLNYQEMTRLVCAESKSDAGPYTISLDGEVLVAIAEHQTGDSDPGKRKERAATAEVLRGFAWFKNALGKKESVVLPLGTHLDFAHTTPYINTRDLLFILYIPIVSGS